MPVNILKLFVGLLGCVLRRKLVVDGGGVRWFGPRLLGFDVNFDSRISLSIPVLPFYRIQSFPNPMQLRNECVRSFATLCYTICVFVAAQWLQTLQIPHHGHGYNGHPNTAIGRH